jgi:hypothetical protein
MKRFQVLLMMIFLNVCLAQDITLKKLYDGIEDMKLEVNTPLPSRGEGDTQYLAENRKLSKLIGEKVNRYCNGGIDLSKKLEYGEVYVDKLTRGSFTKPNSKQELYHVAFCELGSGIVIVENDKAISFYSFSDHDFDFFSVKDVNQNGLNEIMVIVQSKAKGFWSEMHAMQLLEFPKNIPTSLGNFFIGGYPSTWTDGGEDNYVTCSPRAPKQYRKNFPSNIIYVQKSKTPLFFSEGWEVNCDYKEKGVGVKARKVSSLEPIKPVKREVPLTRVF